jgi:hypothetical protein
MVDGETAPGGLGEMVVGVGQVDVADAVAVEGAKEHEEAGEFEEGFAFGAVGGAELEGGGVLNDEEEGEFAFFDEFFAVGFAEAGGDVPVNVADVVAVFVADDLVEFHAAAAEGGAVFAGEGGFDGMAEAPFEFAEEREGGGVFFIHRLHGFSRIFINH